MARGQRMTKDWVGQVGSGTLASTQSTSIEIIPDAWKDERAPTEPTLLRVRGVITLASETAPSGGTTGWGGRFYAGLFAPRVPAGVNLNTAIAQGSEHLLWYDQVHFSSHFLDTGSPTTERGYMLMHGMNLYIDTKAKRKFKYLTTDAASENLTLKLQADAGASPDGFRYWVAIRALFAH